MIDKSLSESWYDLDTVIVYGMGVVASRFVDKIIQDFQVPYIIDNKKYGTSYNNIPIVAYEEIKEKVLKKEYKIVVTTAGATYSGIQQTLEKDGLAEGEDFCHIEQFAVEWYRMNRKQTNIIEVHTAVTTRCTLNCKNCNMFMPYYPQDRWKNYTFNEMKEDIDLMLKYVDYIFWYIFLGGEPFLNKELKNIIAYIGEKYSDKVGHMGITTNGTIIPDDETLVQIKKYKVRISISDYTKTVFYEEKMVKFINKLDEWGIWYIKNQMSDWKDFGFPREPFQWGEDEASSHMRSCSPLFHGVNDKKLYYCHVIWSAEKAGLYVNPEQDYIKLTELDCNKESDKERVSEYCRGKCKDGFLRFCMLCGGCGADNKKIIPVGIQEERK